MEYKDSILEPLFRKAHEDSLKNVDSEGFPLKNYLIFNLKTPKYLGTVEIGEQCLEYLRRLPKIYLPTKTQSLGNFKKALFSFDKPESFYDLIKENAGQGPTGVDLYKIKNTFSFSIWWHNKGKFQDDIRKKNFNTISIAIDPGTNCYRNEANFNCIKEIWLNLCKNFNAAYGYVYFQDATQGNSPRGYRLCLPRLHWYTYFGKEYKEALSITSNKFLPNCELTFGEDDSVLLKITEDNPALLVRPNEKEKMIINSLDKDYFWNEEDDWRNPSFNYKMPNLKFEQ